MARHWIKCNSFEVSVLLQLLETTGFMWKKLHYQPQKQDIYQQLNVPWLYIVLIRNANDVIPGYDFKCTQIR